MFLPSPPDREFLRCMRQVIASIDQYFQEVELSTGGGLAHDTDLARIPHAEWVPYCMQEYGGDLNGRLLRWETRPGQVPAVSGQINLLPLPEIYRDWEGMLYFDFDSPERRARFQTFKIVDFFANEACVGLYHDERADPALYLYTFEDEPEPLGVDIRGYLHLLTQSLGFPYWQYLLVELFQHRGQAQSFAPQRGTVSGNMATEFVEGMSALLPTFNLAAFTALYEQVRLPQ